MAGEFSDQGGLTDQERVIEPNYSVTDIKFIEWWRTLFPTACISHTKHVRLEFPNCVSTPSIVLTSGDPSFRASISDIFRKVSGRVDTEGDDVDFSKEERDEILGLPCATIIMPSVTDYDLFENAFGLGMSDGTVMPRGDASWNGVTVRLKSSPRETEGYLFRVTAKKQTPGWKPNYSSSLYAFRFASQRDPEQVTVVEVWQEFSGVDDMNTDYD